MWSILSPKLTLVSPIPSLPAPSSLVLLGAVLISASSLPGAEVSTALPLQNAGPAAKTLFTALSPEESGIEFINPLDPTHPLKRIYLGAFAFGGIGVGDLNGDGRQDLFLTGGSPKNRIYLQTGEPLRFVDATRQSGLSAMGARSAGPTQVDIDGGGDLDINVCNDDTPNHLWINTETGEFTERTKASGLAISDASLMAAFCDGDFDGDLECFLLNRDFNRAEGGPREHPFELVDNKWKIKPGVGKVVIEQP